MQTQTFTPAQLAELRAGYAKIQAVDPAAPTYGKICAFLDKMGDDMLRQVRDGEIKWLSSLAANRCTRRGVA
jgi:hypothetical protein